VSKRYEIKVALVNIKGRDMASPPLGLAYLATFVRQNMPHCQIRIIDKNFEEPFEELLDFQPDILGISAITMHYNAAIELAQRVKQAMDVPIILGGVHISTCPDSLSPVFDVAVMGEGEITFLELLKLYEKRSRLPLEDLENIPGLLFFRDGRLTSSASREPIHPLDRIPVPDRSYLNSRYFDLIPLPELGDRLVRSTAIITSRGCIYKCVFCSTSVFWRKVRLHSVQYVVSEVRYLVEQFGVQHIKIWDDTLFGKKRFGELRDELKRQDLLGRVKFSCQLTASLVDDELCELLQEVGIVAACFGFESGSEKILRYLKDEAVTVEQNLRAVETCKRHGIYVIGSLMFGSPGETVADMERTLDFMEVIREKGTDQVHLFVTQPFPGTKLWRHGQQTGLIREDFDFDHTSKYDSDQPFFLDDSVSIADFRRVFREARKKVRRFPAHSLRRRLRLLGTHPRATYRAFMLRLKNYSLFGVRVLRIRKRLRQKLRRASSEGIG
jgi:anaerobic magnesium-protoporphyrin IX monomethyl ester cyclase